MKDKTIPSTGRCLFDLLDIDQITLEGAWKPLFVSTYMLLFVGSGRGMLFIDGMTHSLDQNKCFLLHPGMLIEAESRDDLPIQLYQIRFEQIDRDETHEAVTLKGELAIDQPAKLLNLIENLYKHWKEGKDHILQKLRLQIVFYELLFFLYQQSCNEEQETKDTKSRIRRAVDYIHLHYHKDMSRDKLAGIADLSPGYFAQAFKRETGMSPIDYLNDIRIEKAKELLVATSDKLQGVAESVGYKDPFYFSRMFKKTVGLSPTVYIKKNRIRIANLVGHFNGHFRALYSTPFVSMKYDYQFHIEGKQVSCSPEQGMQAVIQSLMDTKVDLIICADEDEEQLERFRKVAPTIVIPWMGNDWRAHFMQIAEIIGKEKTAKAWLARYDEKAEQASIKVKERVNPDEKVMIVRIYDHEYSIYARRNIGNVIYNDLKLKPVEAVNEIPRNANQILVTTAQLADCRPDRLFIVTETSERSHPLLEALTRSKEWNHIPAVRKKQLHYINADPWLEYSASAQELLLEQAVRMLCN
ncbi:AraC family transcriptional regulator [Cohnella sp.]|uniref:AraC family transcriptional regulator n=1 Tax=Cohnella sp. TaxID=1883426 RepID=UPI003563E8DF